MKILHPTINVVPGRSPQQPGPEGQIGSGSGVVRLTNATQQNNAYLLRLRCEHPFWQDDWHVFQALPPADGQDAASEATSPHNKPPEYGPHHRWVKVYVPRGATRDVLMAFPIPEKADARAGTYPFDVVVDTFVLDGPAAAASAGRSRRYTRLPGVVVVRPFFKWSVDITPDERRTGLLKRRAEFEVVVTNEGNDWLYCDLTLPQRGGSKDLLLSSPTHRVAVPPPEAVTATSDVLAMQRVVPLQGVTRLRSLRGTPVAQALGVSAVRVDAPSVAPLLAAPFYGFVEAGAGASVVARPTRDVAQAPTERALLYCPPIPATLTGLVGSLIQNGKTVLLTIIALIVAANLTLLMAEHLFRQNIVAEPISLQADDRGRVVIMGRHLKGARVFVNGSGPAEATIGKPTLRDTPFYRSIVERLKLATGDRDYLTVSLEPTQHNGKPIKLSVQRAGLIPWFGRLLPRYECRNSVVWRDRVAEADARAKQERLAHEAEQKRLAVERQARVDKARAEADRIARAKADRDAEAKRQAAENKAEADRQANEAKTLVGQAVTEMERLVRERDTLSDADKRFGVEKLVSKLNDSLTSSRKAVALDPSNNNGWYQLVSALFYQEKYAEALDQVRQARVHCPDSSELKRMEDSIRARMR